MHRPRVRHVPALLAVLAAFGLVLAACAPAPAQPPGPVVVEGQVVASTSMYSVSFFSDRICARAGSDVLIETDSAASYVTQVIVYDPSGPPPTAASTVFVQNPGHLVLATPSPCFKVIVSISSFIGFPAGTTLDYRIVAPGSVPAEASPLVRTVTASAGQTNAFDLSPRICAPVGTDVTVTYSANVALVGATLYSQGANLGPISNSTSDAAGTFVLTATEPCFSVLVALDAVPPAGATLDYTITW